MGGAAGSSGSREGSRMERRALPGAWGQRRQSLAPTHPGRGRGVPRRLQAPCGSPRGCTLRGDTEHQGRRGGKKQGPGPRGHLPSTCSMAGESGRAGGRTPPAPGTPSVSPAVSVAPETPVVLEELAGTGRALGSGVLRGCGLELELGCGFPWAHPSRPAQGGSNGYRGGWLPEQQGNKESKAMAFGGQTGLP